MKPLWWAAVSRRVPLALVAGLVLCIPSVAWASNYWSISINQSVPANLLSVSQLMALLTLAVALSLSEPRLWTVERTGARFRRLVPVGMSFVITVACPQLVLLAGQVARRTGSSELASANLLFLSALGLVLAAVTGAVVAAGAVLVVSFSAASALQLFPEISPFSPLVASSAEGGHWTVALLSLAAAAFVAIQTLGMTTWQYQRSA